MGKFWWGFIIGAAWQATIGTIITANIVKMWPESANILVNFLR